MGKGKRLKATRAARGANARTPFELLQEAVEAVGDAFGEEANCADAAALLAAAGADLGFTLRPRPVSLVAHQPSSGDVAFMGPKASALIPPERQDDVEDLRPGGKDNGHVVLTLDDPAVLIDANLRQLGAFGIAAPSLVLKVKSVDPADGRWSARLEDLELLYILDDDHSVLIERFGEVKDAAGAEGKRLTEMLRAGMTAAQIRSLFRR